MLKKIPFMKLLIAEIADVDILETPQVGKRQQWVHTSQGMCQHGCSECTNPQIFWTSPFALADFEAFSTMCTR